MDTSTMWTIIGTGIGGVISIVGINIALFSWLRSDIKAFSANIISLEERMFWLSTGKTLSQAILEEHVKIQENNKRLF